jgi:Uma2 family endonuclease
MIVTATPATVPSAEDLDDIERYEIIDGVKVEMSPMSAHSSVLGARLARLLGNYGVERGLGEAYPEILFKLPLGRDRNRRPDVAFVPYSRWTKDRPIPDVNAWDVLPDLCVEVVSPTDRAEEAREKIEEYFESGVRLVWVIYPRLQVVDVFESPDAVRVRRRADELDGGPVLPGFRLRLADLFPEPPATPPEPTT